MCEAFLGFDVRNFEQQVRKKLDPTNTKIASCSYDTVAKRFKVKFNSAADATNLTKGITSTNTENRFTEGIFWVNYDFSGFALVKKAIVWHLKLFT